MNNPPQASRIGRRHRRGVALITTLSLMSLLAILLVSFMVLVKDDRARSKSFLDSVRARSFLEIGAQEAISKIMDGFEDPELAITSSGRRASVTATPGLIEIRYFFKNPWRHNNATGTNAFGSSETPTWPTNIYNNNQTPYFRNPFLPNYGGQDANPRWVPLFSWRYFAPGIRNLRIDPGGGSRSVANPDYNPAAVFNFNTIQNPFYPGELYLSGSPERSVAMRTARVAGTGTSQDRASGGSVGVMNSYRLRPGEASIDRPLYVQWIPVLEHPGRPPGPTNRVIGRYAYWVDVENSKVNLATSTRNYDGSKIHVMTGKNDYEEAFVNNTTLLAQTNPTYANDGRSREARRKLEARTIAYDVAAAKFYDITKSNGNDPANEALPVYYTNWFAWDGNNRPMAADNSMVHWRTFTGMRPATATNISIEGLSAQYAALASGGTRLNTFGEFASYIDPLGATNALTNRLIFSTLRRGHGISTTIYGRDDERDLIGLPRISIVDFQRSINSVSDIASSDLYQRLTNPLYYRALYPNNYIIGGANRSLINTLAPFSGAGTGATADGEIALQQMLLNIAESSRPFNDPPLQDLSRGLIGAKSMPYVAEVGTRVRSAVITLPQSKWVTNTFIETATDSGITYYRPRSAPEANTDGISKPAYAWLTNVVVDLAIGFVNPNPWATHVFAGPDQLTLHLRYDYRQDGGGLTTGATISSNISPVSTYAALPLPGRGTNGGRSDGRHRGVAAVGSLMVFSRLAGSQYLLTDSGTLTNSTPLGSLTPLQIRGWDIRKGAAIFHRVPLPHPTTVPYTPPDWCDMADPGRNVGMTNIGGLGLYQADGRKVGWITRSSHNMNPTNLRKIIYTNPAFLTKTTGDIMIGGNAYFNAGNPEWIAYTEALTNILSGLTNASNSAALVERVQASDPTLGHRTGNTNITLTDIHGVAGPVRGHFYGALGHPWRHSQWPGTPGTPTVQTVRIQTGSTKTTNVSTVTVQVPVGLGFVNQTITVTNIVSTPIYEMVDQLVFPEAPGAFNLGLTDRFRNATVGEPLNPGTNIPQYVMKGPPIVEPRIEKERLDKEYSGLPANKVFQIQDPGASGDSATTPTVGLLINGSGGAHEDTRNYMTSIGQVGFIHSGLLNRHIRFTDAAVNSTNKLNSFQNGPPLSILLDILSPGAFQDNETGDFLTKTQWASGTRQNTPASPRRGTWNINTAIAHDNYLAIREGSPGARNNDINNFGTRVALVPSAQAGAILKQSPTPVNRIRDDEVLDRFLNPYILFRRGIEAWIGIVCGDVTPGNYFGFGAFNGFNPTDLDGVKDSAFGRVSAGRFSWNPGIGVDPVDKSEKLIFAEFDPTQSTVLSRLLHLGEENQNGTQDVSGRNNFEGSFPFAADRADLMGSGNISGSLTNKTLSSIDRFAYFELEHSVGSAATKFAKLNTMLNPNSIVSWNWPNNQQSIQNGPAGAEATQGMMENTAVALLSNQITTSANAFTIHVVAQALQDNPFRKRKKLDGTDDINTGLGYMDVDDKVVAEQWGQIVVARYDPEFANAHKPALELSGNVTNNVYRVLYYRVLDNPK